MTAATGAGLLVIDKPAGMTSHDVVSRVRRLAGTRRVGHAGTLDPLATGVLVVGIEQATRLLTFLVGHDKEYRATIRLGQSTVTDDAEGEVLAAASVAHVGDHDIAAAVAPFLGRIAQRPSAVSAIKVDGRRSYARVRAGEDVVLPERDVTVSRFEILSVVRVDAVIDVEVEVTVSSGTYVRALARDLGQALGVGGHLTALRRTRSGPFTLADATPVEDLTPGALPLLTLDAAVARVLPVVSVDDDQARLVRHGRRLDAPAGTHGTVAVVDPHGRALSIATERQGVLVPDVVFP